MDRITFYNERNKPYYKVGNIEYTNKVAKRLADYEDTGLTPEKVVEMKKTVKELIMLVVGLISSIISIGVAIIVTKLSGEIFFGALVSAFIMTITTYITGYGLKRHDQKRKKYDGLVRGSTKSGCTGRDLCALHRNLKN